MTIFFSILAALLIGAGIWFFLRFFAKRRFRASLKMVLLSVKIHKEIVEGQQAKDFKQEINLTEQLLSGLASLKKPFVLELAVPHIGEEIRFYLAVPRVLSEIAIKQIQGLWTSASVAPAADDYNIFNVHGAAAGAYLLQTEHYALPIRTYQEIGADTFSGIAGAFSKINEIGEGAALQIIARPSKSKSEVQNYIKRLKRGDSLRKALRSDVFSKLSFVADSVKTLTPEEKEKKREDKVIDEEAVKALTAKISKPLFEVNVRFMASAATQFQADDILGGLIAGFNQFGS